MGALGLKKSKTRLHGYLAAEQFFNDLDVIKENKLLTIGFIHELKVAHYDMESVGAFKYGHLQKLLKSHCSKEAYTSQSKYGDRYNIENIATHKLVLIKGVS